MQEKIVVNKIFWKRTYLFIEYIAKKQYDLFLHKNTYKKEIIIPMEVKKLDDKKNTYRAKINTTIAEDNTMLSAGSWNFLTNEGVDIEVGSNILLNIEDFSRVFRYTGMNYAYIATFNISKKQTHIIEEIVDGKIQIKFIEEENNLEDPEMENPELMDDNTHYEEIDDYKITLKISFMKKNKHPERRTFKDLLLETTKLRHFPRKLRIFILKFIIKVYYAIVSHITPKNGTRVMFMSENRVKIMDNLEAIDTRMKERRLDKKFKITYSFRNLFDKKIQNPFEWLFILTKIAKQDYIFVDDYAPVFGYIKLHKKTTLVQVWHAGFGFKLVGYGRFGISGSPKPYTSCHRNYTYGLIGNENLKEIYSEVWGISKDKLLPVGLPRLEHFLDKDYMESVRDKFYKDYPQFKGKKVITFAPTYRGSSQFNATYPYELIDFKKLYSYCKRNNAVVLFGKHHFIKREIPIDDKYKNLIYDFSEYKLNDVFYITDVLITDYSSAFYDFLLLKKPVIFFVFDKDIYSATRGVHRPIEDVAPGKVCITFKEVLDALENNNFKNKISKDFLVDKCATSKILASDKVINYILLHKKVDFDA